MEPDCPAEIIRSSRELEGVSVDLGPDAGLSPNERVALLSELASQILSATPGTMHHAQLIGRYNCNLYVLISFLEHREQLLPESAVIPDEYTLADYLRFRNWRRQHGPITFRDTWGYFPIIAHILVEKRSRIAGSPVMTVIPMRVFKGSLPPNSKFPCMDGGFGTPYEEGTEYIARFSEFGAFCSPLKIFTLNGRKVVSCAPVHYFSPVSSTILTDFEAMVPLDEAIEVMLAHAATTPPAEA